MRTLVLRDSNWDKWKFGDTDAVMTFEARTDNKVPDYANDEISFHLAGTSSNRQPGEYVATAPGHVDDSGQLAQLNTSDLTSLKPGTYVIELWLTNKDTKKVSIFPNDGFVFFTVEQNTMRVSDISNISTKTIQAVYADLLRKINAFKTGIPGKDGVSPKLKVGTVTKLSPDAQPSFTLTPDTTDKTGATVIADLGIPQGFKGDPGKDGANGKDAVQPVFTISTVTTLAAGQQATAILKASNDLKQFDISLGIPQGAKGEPGKNFDIAKTYKSIAEMNNSKGAGLNAPAYVMIASDINDKDNGKMYRFDNGAFSFVANLSGPQGATGPAPVFANVKATKVAASADAEAVLSKNDNGTYTVEFKIPSGRDGKDVDQNAILEALKKQLDDDILNMKW